MTDLDKELQTMLRDRSNDLQPARTIPPATLRKARVQRAIVGLGTCVAVVALGIGGFLVATGTEGTRNDTDVATPQVVATERNGWRLWGLSVFKEDDEICARLEFVPTRGAESEVHETCAAEDEVIDARRTVMVGGTPLAWGSVSSEVSSVETQRFGFSTLIGVDPPEFFDLPDEFGSERRLFMAFDPNGIDAVTAKDSDAEELDTVTVRLHDPVRFASGRIENTSWSLSGRLTDEGICVTAEQERKEKRSSSGNTMDFCGLSWDDLSLTQVSLYGVDSVLVFGTLPVEAQRVALVLEDGPPRPQPLSARGGGRNLPTFYTAVVEARSTEGSVVSLDRGGAELDRRELCAPGAPQMSNRGNVPQVCGDGIDSVED